MRVTHVLDLDDAEVMLQAAASLAIRQGWKVSMAIVDAGGCLLAFKRLDGATVSSAATSISKARSAALTRRPTKFFEEMIAGGRVGATMIDGVFPIEGGLPIQIDGNTVGGFAVSGLKSELDTELVEAGLAAFTTSR